MTRKQRTQVALQKAVTEVMMKHQQKWQGVAELKKSVERFKGNLRKIEAYEAILKTELAPLKEKMENSRKVLVDQVFPVASVLGLFAYDTDERKLGKLGRVKFSELENMGDGSLRKYCRKVLKITGPLLDQETGEGKKSPRHLIRDYGLTADHLQKLGNALDGWERERSYYIATREKRKKSKVKMDLRIRENNQILSRKLDRMMRLFRESRKTFYEAYIKSRIPAEPVDEHREAPVAQEAEKTTVSKKAAPGTENAPSLAKDSS
jgi:hypothetical protein